MSWSLFRHFEVVDLQSSTLWFDCLSFQLSLDKLYMSSAVHIFKNKMKPLLLEQRKKGQGHVYNSEMVKLAKTMMKYINCIQNTELATATVHNISQELPPGQESSQEGIHPGESWSALLNLCLPPAGYEKTQSLKFCLALAEAQLKEPNLEVIIWNYL